MAAYTTTLVILANSCKNNGRCLAGKVLTATGFGPWVRPVSARPTGELLPCEQRLAGGGQPALLDLVEVPFSRPAPTGFQSENHVIAQEGAWTKHGWLDTRWLRQAVDEGPSLWINDSSSANGCNDRVPEWRLGELDGSLRLIGPVRVDLRVTGGKVRAQFHYRRVPYDLSVTDPRIKGAYARRAEGGYGLGEVFLCVSLAPAWHGYADKLAAAIIAPNAG